MFITILTIALKGLKTLKNAKKWPKIAIFGPFWALRGQNPRGGPGPPKNPYFSGFLTFL